MGRRLLRCWGFPLEHLGVPGVQGLAASLGDGAVFSLLLHIHPDSAHRVEVAADAPLDSGPFEGIGKPALHRFDVAVFGPVGLGHPLLALLIVDGEGAELGAAADLVPEGKLGFPVEGSHRFVQPLLDGPAGEEGHRQPPAFVLGGLLDAPLHILCLERGGQLLGKHLFCHGNFSFRLLEKFLQSPSAGDEDFFVVVVRLLVLQVFQKVPVSQLQLVVA